MILPWLSIIYDEYPTREYGTNTIFRQTKWSDDILLLSFTGNLYKLDHLFRPIFTGKLKNVQYPQFVTRIDLTGDGSMLNRTAL